MFAIYKLLNKSMFHRSEAMLHLLNDITYRAPDKLLGISKMTRKVGKSPQKPKRERASAPPPEKKQMGNTFEPVQTHDADMIQTQTRDADMKIQTHDAGMKIQTHDAGITREELSELCDQTHQGDACKSYIVSESEKGIPNYVIQGYIQTHINTETEYTNAQKEQAQAHAQEFPRFFLDGSGTEVELIQKLGNGNALVRYVTGGHQQTVNEAVLKTSFDACRSKTNDKAQ